MGMYPMIEDQMNNLCDSATELERVAVLRCLWNEIAYLRQKGDDGTVSDRIEHLAGRIERGEHVA